MRARLTGAAAALLMAVLVTPAAAQDPTVTVTPSPTASPTPSATPTPTPTPTPEELRDERDRNAKAVKRIYRDFESEMRPKLANPPSTYWWTNCYATFQEEPLGLELLDKIGPHKVMWASDYPHPESTLGYTRRSVRDIFDVTFHRYETKDVLLLFYECELVWGDVKHVGVADHAWVEPLEVRGYPLPPADENVVRKLEARAGVAR